MSYEDARELVRRTLAPQWRDGTFCLDDRQLVDNDDMWVFRVGAREHLVEKDVAFARFGGGVPAVLKATGQLVWVPEVRMIPLVPTLRFGRNPSPTVRT